MKKALRQTQTLRAGCRRNQIFSPRRRPLPRGAGRPKFNQLEMVTTFTYRQTKFGENRCTQFRVIVVTDTVRPSARRPPVLPPQTGPITIHCAAMLSTQCDEEFDRVYAKETNRHLANMYSMSPTMCFLFFVFCLFNLFHRCSFFI